MLSTWIILCLSFICFDRNFFKDGKKIIKRNRIEWDLNLKVSETLVVLDFGEAANRGKCSGFSHEIFILLRNQMA